MDLVATLLELGIDAKTACLIWFAVCYEKRLKAIESLITSTNNKKNNC